MKASFLGYDKVVEKLVMAGAKLNLTNKVSLCCIVGTFVITTVEQGYLYSCVNDRI